jgi:hypothetical protein
MDATAATQADRLQTVGRLDELAVNEDVLRDAAQTGIEAAGTCTAHDPASLAGFLTWAKATRALRDELVPQGWSPGERRNYATVVNPSGTFAIAVAGGNAATGQREATLRTRTEKGPATKEAVQENEQLSFADRDSAFGQRSPEGDGRHTWLLLHYYDEQAEEIRVELSLPSRITDGYVTAWRERLILAPIPLTSGSNQEAEEPEEEIDVQVERKAD